MKQKPDHLVYFVVFGRNSMKCININELVMMGINT